MIKVKSNGHSNGGPKHDEDEIIEVVSFSEPFMNGKNFYIRLI